MVNECGGNEYRSFRPSAVTERSTVFTVVLSKSFSALMSGPLTSDTATAPANCLSSDFHFSFDALVRMAVHHVQHQRAVVAAGRSIEVRARRRTARSCISGVSTNSSSALPLRVVGEQLQRIINGLQEQALVVGENGRDHVHQLRHVGDLHDVGVIDECIQKGRDHQRVFQVVVLLQNAPARACRSPRARYQTFHSSQAI